MISPQSFQDGDKNYMNGHRLTHFMVSQANVWRRVATQSQFTDIWFHKWNKEGRNEGKQRNDCAL